LNSFLRDHTIVNITDEARRQTVRFQEFTLMFLTAAIGSMPNPLQKKTVCNLGPSTTVEEARAADDG
jgi:hypothetical protein